jgi:spermidine/putrescine transport system permease protein
MNWNMGATIGVILIALMLIVMLLTSRKQHKKEIEL